MTKQIKVGDVVEVVEATGHSAELGSIGVVEEVFEDDSFWVKVYEEGWGRVYSQTLTLPNVKLLSREGELKKVTGNNLPKHYSSIGNIVKVLGVCSSMSYEHFENEGMSVKVKLPASEGSLVQYVNVYDLSEVDTVKEGTENKSETLRNLDEGTLIFYTDESDNIKLATFVGIEEDGMFTVDTQPSDTLDGLKTIPNHRFEDSLGFSIGDTVMYIGEPSFYHQLEEGDVMPVLGLDSDGDLVLDTSKLEHVTQSEQYLYDELCLDLSLVDKTSLDEELETEEEVKTNEKGDDIMTKFKVGDIVRITDTKCLHSKVKVGDIAKVKELGQYSITVKMISGDIEGRRQYVSDYQLELVTEESPKKVLFKKGTQFRNEEDVNGVYGLYKDFKEGGTVALIAQYDKFSFDTDIAEIIEVTDLGSEECVFQPYGNAFSDAEKVIVTESFSTRRTVFERGSIYAVETLTVDDEGVFTETTIILPSGGRFTIQGVRDYSEFFAEHKEGEDVAEEVTVTKSTDFKKGDVVKVTDSHYYSHSVSVGDVAKVDGVDSDGDLILKFVGDSYLDGLIQYTDGEDIELLVRTPEVKTKFEVGDIVSIKNGTIFNRKVAVGDKAVITSDEYDLLMLTGKFKGQQQVCLADSQDYANKYLELVRN